MRILTRSFLAASVLWLPGQTSAAPQDPFYVLPDLAELSADGMRDVVQRYSTDQRVLQRFWDVSVSAQRRRQEGEFLEAWRAGLARLDFDGLGLDDRIGWLLLQNRLAYELQSLELEQARWAETEALMTFAPTIAELQETRRALAPIDPPSVAARLDVLRGEVDDVHERVRACLQDGIDADSGLRVPKLVANRAAGQVRDLRRTLQDWFRYYDGYDPLFSWWCSEPHSALNGALDRYARFLRERVVGVQEGDSDTILGDPIGREALLVELEREMIAYTPEELIEIANSEFEWCDQEMLRASRELGFRDDWRAALDHVKGQHVAPGEQPELIRMLAWEAIDFLEARELLTIPAFAKSSWRMQMMSPERQKVNPYFTGGETISVSFPTSGMSHGDKLMSMRGNNVHFSRATVHHELIPGHHLQQYMTARYKTHRRPFGTPFWGEGWALYWEMLLWDEGFPKTPEDRVGMLFWRRHRCARIVFSLGFHLGEMTPRECIDFLVERVGHEERNATAEVRRSVQGGYGPLYQVAYMMGGLQFRALHAELVGSGKMTNRAFHDAILREGSIPVEMVRAKLIGTMPARDARASWRFYVGNGGR